MNAWSVARQIEVSGRIPPDPDRLCQRQRWRRWAYLLGCTFTSLGIGLWAMVSITRPPSPPSIAAFENLNRPGSGVVHAPGLSGWDARHLPFTFRAEIAIRDANGGDRVHLERVTGEFVDARGEKVKLESPGGAVYPADRRVTLTGPVHLESANGARATMDSAEYLGNAELFRSNSSVYFRSPFLAGHADGMLIAHSPDRIRLHKVALTWTGGDIGLNPDSRNAVEIAP